MTNRLGSLTEPRIVDAAWKPGAVFRDVGVFPNAEVHAALMAMYDAKLAEWPVHHEEFEVPTRYGMTHIVAAGSPDAPPIMLLHMAACTSFVWAPIIAPLASRYRTYAVDIIGDINKSVLADRDRRPKDGAGMADWLRDVANALRLDKSDVIAGSYGGWVGMHYASRAPHRVRRLVLIVPMGLPGWFHTTRVLFRLATIQIGVFGSKMERTLSYLMGDDPAARRLGGDWLSHVFTSKCRMNAPSPQPMSAKRLAALTMATLIVLGERDPLVGNPERAARRATSHIPLVEIEVVPGGTHAVHIEAPERVATRILDFLDQ